MPNDFVVDEASGDSSLINPLTIAVSPKSLTNDEGTVTERDMKDVIEAVNFSAANTASQNKAPWGMRIARTIRGGTT